MFNYKNKRKRFGTIMTKEIEDTILNDTEQMENLYEEIDNLKLVINNKNLEIKLLKEENEAYRLQLETFKSLIKDNIMEHDDDASEGSISDEEEIVDIIRPKKVTLNNCLYNYYKNKNQNENVNPLPTPSSSTDNINISEENVDTNKNLDQNIEMRNSAIIIEPKKYNIRRDKTKSAIERYPIKIYNQTDSEILQFVSSENKFLINYQYKIAEKLNSKIEDIKIKDIIDFKIKYEGLNDNRDQRVKLKRRIERCKVLYEKYDERLGRFKISLGDISDMTEKLWNEWLIEFDKIVNELYTESIKCDYIYNNKKTCGKYNCKIKHKRNI